MIGTLKLIIGLTVLGLAGLVGMHVFDVITREQLGDWSVKAAIVAGLAIVVTATLAVLMRSTK